MGSRRWAASSSVLARRPSASDRDRYLYPRGRIAADVRSRRVVSVFGDRAARGAKAGMEAPCACRHTHPFGHRQAYRGQADSFTLTCWRPCHLVCRWRRGLAMCCGACIGVTASEEAHSSAGTRRLDQICLFEQGFLPLGMANRNARRKGAREGKPQRPARRLADPFGLRPLRAVDPRTALRLAGKAETARKLSSPARVPAGSLTGRC